MLFADIPGHFAIKERLMQNALSGRVSHAQMFLGQEGGVGLPLAIAYAQYLNCTDRKPQDSCGVCPSCNKFQKLIHPDLHFSFPTVRHPEIKTGEAALSSRWLKEWREAVLEQPYMRYNDWMNSIFAENKQGNISVQECHAIISNLSMASFEGEYKVLILWLPEFLKEAGNVLLKMIEEPPPKTLFLLVAHNEDLILSTIKSRMQMLRIPRTEPEDLAKYLLKHYEVEKEEAMSLALLSEGNVNAAIRLFNEDVNVNETLFFDFLRKCYTRNGLEISAWVETIAPMGREKHKNFLAYGLHMLRECLLFRFVDEQKVNLRGSELEFVRKFSPFVNNRNLPGLTRALEQASYYVERNGNSKLIFHSLALDVERYLAIKEK